MKKTERCWREDCIYRNRNDPSMAGRCSYWMMTGHCRTVGLPPEQQLPCNCPRYILSGRKPRARRSDTPADWQAEAMALYREGATDREIASALDIHTERFARLRRKQGLKPNPDQRGPAPRFDWKRAECLYRQGMNDREIADALGCAISSVWRWRYKYMLFPQHWRIEEGKHER